MSERLSLDAMKSLLESLRDGTATTEQHARLDQLLRESPAARSLYVRYMLLCSDLQSMLSQEAALELPLENSVEDSPQRCLVEGNGWQVEKSGRLRHERANGDGPLTVASGGARRNRWSWRIAVAASVTIGLLLASRLIVPGPGAPSPDADNAPAVATLVATMDAQWGDDQPMPVGSRLSGGPLQLKQGLAAIQFDSGAAVILQGPSQCVLESPSHLALCTGRLSAQVPVEAIGFTVRTAQATVVDLGTEFGVSSQEAGPTDVHVFRGQVALASPRGQKNSKQLLNEGIAKRVEADGVQIEDLRPDELAFVRQQEFEARIKALNNSPYHRWLAYSYQLRREPALVLYYTFDNPMEMPDRVSNRAGATAGKLDGLLGDGRDLHTRPQWVAAGRWPQQRAFRFDATQKQQIRVPHGNPLNITQAMTVAAWIRPNSALLGLSAVLVSKGMPSGNDARPNYELGLIRRRDSHGDGLCSVYFCSGSRRITSPGIPVVPGQWMHVAATAKSGRTVLYVNGQTVACEDSSELLPNEGDLLIGAAAGDLRSADLGGDGSFEGLIGELVLVRRVMSDREILTMVSSGKPAR